MSPSHLPARGADDDGDANRSRRSSRGEAGRLTPLREVQLVEAHRRGDPEALTELIRAYQRRVYSICYRMLRRPEEAADLTQDVLLRVIEALDGYDGRSKLSTWVIRIAMNMCINHLRRETRRRHASIDDLSNAEHDDSDDWNRAANLPASREPTADERVEQSESREALRRCLADLDPEMRGILVLRDMQDLDYEQISEVLEIPIGTVKSRLFRARTALREAFERFSHDRKRDTDHGAA